MHSVVQKELLHLNGTVKEVAADPDPSVAPSPDKIWRVRGFGQQMARSVSIKAACLTRLMLAEERPANTLTKGDV